MAVDAHGMPVRVIVTQGTDADCQQAVPLIAKMTADYLLADRGYDADYIVEQAKRQGMEPVIPSRKTGRNSATMTDIFIRLDILLRMPFCTLSSGVASQHVMPKEPVLSLLPCIFDA